MRARTEAHLPGRCSRCWVKQEFCVCPDVKVQKVATKVVLVRHEREAQKSTGTARIAALALPSMVVLPFGDSNEGLDDTLRALKGAWLLFPSDGHLRDAGPSVPAGRPSALIVLDGTWRQTRKMLKKLPSLQALPRLALPAKVGPSLRLREGPADSGCSTLEALAAALGLLEGQAVGTALDALHALYVERVFRARGVWGLKSSGLTAQC